MRHHPHIVSVIAISAALALFCSDVVSAQGDRTESRHQQANRLLDAQKWDSAMVVLDQLALEDSTDPGVWINRGMALFGLNRFDEAIVSLDRAIAIDPALSAAYLNKGIVLANVGRYAEAALNLDRADSLSPDNPLVLYNRAMAYNATGRYDEAFTLVNRSIQLTESAPALVLRGEILMSIEKPDRALIDFERAIALSPPSEVSPARLSYLWQLVADASYAIGNVDKAITSLQKGLLFDSTSTVAYQNLAIYLTVRGDLPNATNTIRTVVNREPENVIAWGILGDLLYRQELYDEAEKAFVRFNQLDPNDPYGYRPLALLAFRRKDLEAGCAYVQKGLEVASGSDYATPLNELAEHYCVKVAK